MRFLSASRWLHSDQLIKELRALGNRLVTAQPKEFASGNVVRRVLALAREIAGGTLEDGDGSARLNSMFSLLSTSEDTQERPASTSRRTSKDDRADIIEGIQELIDEIQNIEESLAGMSLDMIHENEVLLTPTPGSKTVLQFLLRASQKRRFSVLVTESFPNDTERAHEFASTLAKAGIETLVIPDTAASAVMSRVGKVIMGTRTVLANGGSLSSSGAALVCECAQEYKTPVLALTGLYKLSPLYPFDTESLIEVGDSSKVIDFADSILVEKVQVMNPMFDYIPPEHIDIYITNIGGFSPSFTYRIILDYYNSEDVSL